MNIKEIIKKLEYVDKVRNGEIDMDDVDEVITPFLDYDIPNMIKTLKKIEKEGKEK